MNHWLVKSEPDSFSWDDQVSRGAKGEPWTGVRNHTARQNLKAMKKGEKAFFYHSNVGKEIVGIVEVCKESAPDSTTDDPRWDCVHIRAIKALKRPVTLEEAKADPRLQDMALVKNTRLSVQPVSDAEWRIVCELGGVEP